MFSNSEKKELHISDNAGALCIFVFPKTSQNFATTVHVTQGSDTIALCGSFRIQQMIDMLEDTKQMIISRESKNV